MHPPDLLKMNYPPSILLYGPPGTAKTSLVSQLSGGYLFDFDAGMLTAAKLKDKFFDARQKIDFDIYRDPNPMQPVMFMRAMKKMQDIVQACGERSWADANVKNWDKTSEARKWDHDACIVDSLTGLCQSAQLHIQAASGDSFKKMEIQNWGLLINLVEKFLTLLRSLNVLTVVTAHVDWIEKKKVVKDKIVLGESEITDIFPSSATNKHGMKKLMWLFDEVLYTDLRPVGAGRIEYRVTGVPTDVIKARTRSGIGRVVHNELGMVGLLKKMGFDYGKKA